MSRTRLLVCLSLLVPVFVSIVGCGGGDQTSGTQVAPSVQAKQAEKDMENFMKNQGKK